MVAVLRTNTKRVPESRGDSKESNMSVEYPRSEYMEHANMTTSCIESTKRFLLTAFPHWRVRGNGTNVKPEYTRQWMHVGSDVYYVALESAQRREPQRRRPYYDIGINHIGFVVTEALHEIKERLLKAGYPEGIKAAPHPYRSRMYFYDGVGNEFEFVQYHTHKANERNDYTIDKEAQQQKKSKL